MQDLSEYEGWFERNKGKIVRSLASADDTQVMHFGLCLVDILQQVFFSRGARTWFRHDLDFFYACESRGVHFLPTHFYSPVPTTSQIPSSHWSKYRTPGLKWNEVQQWRTLEERLSRFIKEFHSSAKEGELADLVRVAPFTSGDLSLYYAFLRDLRPRRVVEVGAGACTRVAIEALRLNNSGEVICIEPYPSQFLLALKRAVTLRREMIQETPISLFEELVDGDILFIDSTHIVTVGSDVNRLILEVLPILKEGVLVHFHDIALPDEIPESWVKREALFWNEQYLLQAFLAFNSDYEIVLSSSYLGKADLKRYGNTVAFDAAPGGGSMWIRRVSGGG